MTHFALTLASIAFAVYFVRQCRKPTGWLGRAVAWNMNTRHAKLTAWALEGISVDQRGAVLDVGCGGGGTVRRFAAGDPSARIVGLDYAMDSVRAARNANAGGIATGRVAFVRASASHVPFAAHSFDLVTAFETHYYWPGLEATLRELRRVLRPGGTIVLGVEAYRTQSAAAGFFLSLIMRAIGGRILTVQEHDALLKQAGFTDVVVQTNPSRGWLRAIGRQPAG